METQGDSFEKDLAMLRDESLIPLSRQHQHALALCVRIDRAAPIAVDALPSWRAEIARQFELEIRIHFQAEERVLFPAAREFAKLAPLVEELVAEHGRLREFFFRADQLSGAELVTFARGLSGHIRKEERQLFECMQELMDAEALAELGARLKDELKGAVQACALPAAGTKQFADGME